MAGHILKELKAHAPFIICVVVLLKEKPRGPSELSLNNKVKFPAKNYF
jgi:hypothetical protein